jgi:capsid protein
MLRTIFEAWCEEAVRRSLVELPRNCKPWSNATKAAFCKCDVLGPGMPTPNPADTVEAAIAAISANLSTFESECAGFGVDFSEILKQRKLENDALRESGLPVPGEAPKAGASEPDGDEGEVEDEEAEGEEDEDEGEGPSFPGYRFRDSDQGGGGVTPGQR